MSCVDLDNDAANYDHHYDMRIPLKAHIDEGFTQFPLTSVNECNDYVEL